MIFTLNMYRLWTKVFARWRRPFCLSKKFAGNKTYFFVIFGLHKYIEIGINLQKKYIIFFDISKMKKTRRNFNNWWYTHRLVEIGALLSELMHTVLFFFFFFVFFFFSFFFYTNFTVSKVQMSKCFSYSTSPDLIVWNDFEVFF